MGEAMRNVLDADIGPPLKVMDGVDLARQRKGLLDLADLFGRGIVLEGKEDDVPQDAVGRGNLGHLSTFLGLLNNVR